MSDRICRECGIDHIEPGMEIDGEPLCWAQDDLCSCCQEHLQAQLVLDAKRYRFLRHRQTREIDIAVGGLFAGRIPENLILGGEDLDRAIDEQLGLDIPQEEPLEKRLAACLAECIDGTLLTGALGGDARLQTGIRLGFFRPELAEKAAALLEEFGI